MNKMLIALVVLVALVGATAATAADPAVTINVDRRTIILGGTPTLSGTADPNSLVTITAKPQDESAWTTTAQADAVGAWTLQVSPWVQTTYQAAVGSVSSLSTIILVKPRVQLVRRGAGRYEVIVAAGRSFVGKQVLLGKEVLTKPRHWNYVKKITLKTNVRTDGTTISYFKYTARHGTHLKIFLPGLAARSLGYQGVTSNFIVA